MEETKVLSEDNPVKRHKRIAMPSQTSARAMHGGYKKEDLETKTGELQVGEEQTRTATIRRKSPMYKKPVMVGDKNLPHHPNTKLNPVLPMPASNINTSCRTCTEQIKTTAGVKIIPLGGLEEIGMNMTAFEYKDTIIIVDCGLAFPDEDTPGIDMIIPDVSYLKKNIEKVKAFFITHGHEDHIGALPYVLKDINVPVYGTRLTLAIIDEKLEQHKMKSKVKRNIVKFGQTVTTGEFKVEFIKTNHSIQDSAALAIQTDVGTIIHTGDFKVDHTPVFGDPINLARFAEYGQKGVLALLCDSTNAARSGSVMSEKSVGNILDDLFVKYKNKRILIATFASNVDRVQQIINAAYKTGKKVIIEGRSMITIMGIAVKLGYINLPENTVIDIEDMRNYKEEDIAIIMTGSQGEQMSALTKVSRKKHTKIRAGLNDVVIFSSHPIPGNEKAVNEVINNFMMDGIEVVLQDVHVSGHACADDIKLIYALVKPKYAIPVHGDFRQRTAQAEIAESLGYDKERVKLIRSGDVLEVCSEYAQVINTVEVGEVMVDGGGVGNVGNVVIKERKQLATDGIVMITMVFDTDNYNLLSGPEIICRGFIYMRESKALIYKMRRITEGILKRELSSRSSVQWDSVKETIKVSLGDFLWDELKAKPIILPVVMEV